MFLYLLGVYKFYPVFICFFALLAYFRIHLFVSMMYWDPFSAIDFKMIEKKKNKEKKNVRHVVFVLKISWPGRFSGSSWWEVERTHVSRYSWRKRLGLGCRGVVLVCVKLSLPWNVFGCANLKVLNHLSKLLRKPNLSQKVAELGETRNFQMIRSLGIYIIISTFHDQNIDSCTYLSWLLGILKLWIVPSGL